MQRLFVIFLTMVTGICACDRHSQAGSKQPAPPAHVENAVTESKLATVTLVESAVSRLGIETRAIERRTLARNRLYGGIVHTPADRQIDFHAAFAGMIRPPTEGRWPVVGSRVSRGQELLTLVPVLASQPGVLPPSDLLALARARADLAESMTQAEGQVATATARLSAAKTTLERNEHLRRSNVGSEKALDEARAEVAMAEAEMAAANSRLSILRSTNLQPGPDEVTAARLQAPIDGVLESIRVGQEQVVAAGAILFRIAGLDPVWIKVPVYVGEMPTIQSDVAVRLTQPGSRPDEQITTAAPVVAPPSANAVSATVDLIYEAQNHDGSLIPGQRVAVLVPLRGQTSSLVLPWSAVVFDSLGGSWVYEQVEPRTFARRRVEVQDVQEDLAILASGPPEGTQVVTAGAAELFGTEFGMGK